MLQLQKPLVLASGSPRRKELLEQVGLSFTVDVADVDENLEEDRPASLVEQLSRKKALAVLARHPEAIVLGADTVVAYEDEILGKPEDEADALNMLSMLAGRVHHVYTGVTLCYMEDGQQVLDTFHVCTKVSMYDTPRDLLEDYIRTGEPMDKAGSYGIQGKGAVLVKVIEGDYNNVVGLPVSEVFRRLDGMVHKKSY
ncbi:MAG: septum formation protein Maf [Lachnospiraceae bacterium]|nr:septum formation protein Maf [Lachnospiraceae bacterium]